MKVQRPDIAEVMERDLAALSLVAEVAHGRTSFGQGIRIGRRPRPVRAAACAPSSTSNARQRRWRRWPRSSVRRRRPRPEDLSRPVHPPAARSGAVRGMHRRRCGRSSVSGMALDRRQLADRLLRSMLDQVLQTASSTPIRTPATCSSSATDARPHRLRRGRTARPDPAGAVVDMLVAIARRDVSLAARRRRARRRRQRARPPERLERALARLHGGQRPANGAVEPTIMQDLVSTISAFGMRLPGDLVLLSRALATLDGTLRIMCPGTVARRRRHRGDDLGRRADRSRRRWSATQLLAALPHLRHLPDRHRPHVDARRPGRSSHPPRRRRGRRSASCGRLSIAGCSSSSDSMFLLACRAAADRRRRGPGWSPAELGLFEVFGYGGLLRRHRPAAAGRGRGCTRRDDMRTAMTEPVRRWAPAHGRRARLPLGRLVSGTSGIRATSFGSSCGESPRSCSCCVLRLGEVDQRRVSPTDIGRVGGVDARSPSASCCSRSSQVFAHRSCRPRWSIGLRVWQRDGVASVSSCRRVPPARPSSCFSTSTSKSPVGFADAVEQRRRG